MAYEDKKLVSCEKINPGRVYKDYLREYKKKDIEIKRIMMQKAKETIDQVRKCREENGYDEKDQYSDEDFFWDEM